MIKKQFKRKKNTLIKNIARIILAIIISAIFWIMFCKLFMSAFSIESEEYKKQALEQQKVQSGALEAHFKPNSALVEPTTKEIIKTLAPYYDVDVETALRIAECESQFGTYNYNWEGSSAKGVYQFIDSTFANYCDGDVLNEKDNITCFMKLYNKFPHWWKQCNIIINNK
jgi:soluble lytic murein transglycosylase-like protein